MHPHSLTFFTFCILTLLSSTAIAQERAPHGLAYENPVAFPPAAVDFFHPKSQTKSCGDGCSPLPMAAQIDGTQAQESLLSTTRKEGKGLGSGGIAAIVLGLAFVAVVAVSGVYVFVRRRADVDRSNFVKPDSSV